MTNKGHYRSVASALGLALLFCGMTGNRQVHAVNPPPPGQYVAVRSDWLFNGQSSVTQWYGCSSEPLELFPPDQRCNYPGTPGLHWHGGIDISGGNVQQNMPFYAGQPITLTNYVRSSSFSEIEGKLNDGNWLIILHSQTASPLGGYSWGQQLGTVGNVGASYGAHIHFEISGPNHVQGASYPDWTDISPWPELLWPAPALVSATWQLNYNIPPTSPNPLVFNYGFGGAIPVVGDWCGTGIKSNGVFSAGHWYLYCGPRQDTGSGPGPGNLGPNAFDFSYGATTDMPVVGDWTGKGYDSVGVVGITYGGTPACPQQGWQLEWRLLNRNVNDGSGPNYDFCYGNPGDWPVVGNWTGVVNRVTQLYIDGVGVARPNQATPTPSLDWYLKAPVFGHAWGGTADVGPFTYPSQPMPAFVADIPVVGDWSGVCRTGIGVVRPGNDYGTLNWLLRSAGSLGVSPGPPTFSTFPYGNPTDSRVAGAWRLGYYANCLYDTIGVAQ